MTFWRKTDNWSTYFLPYTFHRMKSDRFKHLYLPLNRNYKPLGYIGKDYVDYDDYIGVAVAFHSDPLKYRDVWFPKAPYLYDDSKASRDDYFERLAALATRAMPLAGLIDEPPRVI